MLFYLSWIRSSAGQEKLVNNCHYFNSDAVKFLFLVVLTMCLKCELVKYIM